MEKKHFALELRVAGPAHMSNLQLFSVKNTNTLTFNNYSNLLRSVLLGQIVGWACYTPIGLKSPREGRGPFPNRDATSSALNATVEPSCLPEMKIRLVSLPVD